MPDWVPRSMEHDPQRFLHGLPLNPPWAGDDALDVMRRKALLSPRPPLAAADPRIVLGLLVGLPLSLMLWAALILGALTGLSWMFA